jgi:hypothetical protein
MHVEVSSSIFSFFFFSSADVKLLVCHIPLCVVYNNARVGANDLLIGSGGSQLGPCKVESKSLTTTTAVGHPKVLRDYSAGLC